MGSGTIGSAVGAHVLIDGVRYLNFAGSSYLGLAAHSSILDAGVVALRRYGAGAPLARQQMATPAHLAFEAEAAAFFGSDGAVFLASGYHFAFMSIAAIRAQFAAVFLDEYAHYSLREAVAASGVKSYTFRHLDVADLERQLKEHVPACGRPLVATDGVFATLGNIAPLSAIAHVIVPYGGRLLVDESHSFGVLGTHGRGAAEYHGIPAGLALLGGSLGKGFGVCGGVLTGTEDEVSTFRRTPVGVGAAAGLPASAAMAAASLRYVREHPEVRQRLQANVVQLKIGLRELGLQVEDNIVPIAAFTAGRAETMQKLQRTLLSERILVYHITYIASGEDGVIRCGVFADHTSKDIESLLAALRRLL